MSFWVDREHDFQPCSTCKFIKIVNLKIRRRRCFLKIFDNVNLQIYITVEFIWLPHAPLSFYLILAKSSKIPTHYQGLSQCKFLSS